MAWNTQSGCPPHDSPTVEARYVLRPDASSAAANNHAVLVFPLVPVTPRTTPCFGAKGLIRSSGREPPLQFDDVAQVRDDVDWLFVEYSLTVFAAADEIVGHHVLIVNRKT